MNGAGFSPGKHLRSVVWIGLGVLVGVLVLATQRPAHALPEYAARTGQPCATCHVNPAGGGPRTLRGSLWLAQGRPDDVPALPGGQAETGEEALDGVALYQKFTCAGCHGSDGEGGAGPAINETELSADEIARIIRNGQGAMMGFGPDVVSDAQLQAIVQYIQALGRGDVQADSVSEKRPLPPVQLTCGPRPSGAVAPKACGGN